MPTLQTTETRLQLFQKRKFMNVYDFREIKLHAYQTNDLMNDESYILENKDNVLLIEFPAFYDNLEEFENYVKNLGKTRPCIRRNC